MDLQTEPTLLQQIAKGDRQAVGQCIDRFGGLVWSLARRFCANTADAEDAVQEIFADVWSSAPRFDPSVASETTFVAMIARRRLIDQQRKRSRAPKFEALSPAIDPGVESGVTPAEIQDEANRAKAALHELSVEQQKALKLSIYEGFSHAQIAERLDVPLGTVKTNIRRGLIRMREMLGVHPQSKGGAS